MSVVAGAVEEVGFLRGRGLVLLSGVFLSIGGPLIRLIERADEWQFLSYRALALVLFLWLVLSLRYPGRVSSTLRAAGWAGALAGAFLACAFVGFVFSITHSTVANTLFLLSAAPFAAALLGWLFLDERVGRATWLAMLGAFAGVAVMIGEGLAEHDLFGDLAALGAALGFAAFSVTLRHGRRVDMLPAVMWAGIISGLGAATVCLASGTGLEVPAGDIGLSFVYGALGIGGGLLLFIAGSRYVPAAELTLLSLTEVVLGPLWVWLAFSEEPSVATLAGGVILLLSIAALTYHGVRRSKPPPMVT